MSPYAGELWGSGEQEREDEEEDEEAMARGSARPSTSHPPARDAGKRWTGRQRQATENPEGACPCLASEQVMRMAVSGEEGTGRYLSF